MSVIPKCDMFSDQIKTLGNVGKVEIEIAINNSK